MELKPCKMATPVSLIFMLLLILTTIGSGHGAANGDECSAISHSKTFRGDCRSKAPCVAACRGEGYPDGYCFKDVADPDHPFCMCTAPCPPDQPATTTSTSLGNTV